MHYEQHSNAVQRCDLGDRLSIQNSELQPQSLGEQSLLLEGGSLPELLEPLTAI